MDNDTKPAGLGCNEGLGPTPQDDEHPCTYASTQATHCAGCGEYKHTPLRIDAPQQPLSDEQLRDAARELPNVHFAVLAPCWPSAKALARAVERAHGIGA